MATYLAHIFLGILGFILNLVVLINLWRPAKASKQQRVLQTTATTRKCPAAGIKPSRKRRLPRFSWRSLSVADMTFLYNEQHVVKRKPVCSIELDELVPKKRTTPPNYVSTFLLHNKRPLISFDSQRRNSCPGTPLYHRHTGDDIKLQLLPPTRRVEWANASPSLSHNNNPTTVLQETHNRRRRHTLVALHAHDAFNRSMLTTHIINACWAEMLVSVLHCGGQVGKATELSPTWNNNDHQQQQIDELPAWLLLIRPLGLYAVAFITAAVAVDRYLAVLYPLHHTALTRTAKRARARLFMLICWLLAIACSVPKALIAYLVDDDSQASAARWCAHRVHELYQLAVMYYLPALVVCFCYARIFSTFYSRHRQHCRSIAADRSPAASPLRAYSRLSSTASQLYAWTTSTTQQSAGGSGVRTKLATSTRIASLNNDDKVLRTLRLSIRFVCTFLLCSMPYATVRLITVTTHNDYCTNATDVSGWSTAEALLLVLATSHCVVNPLVFYGRRLYRSLLCTLIHRITGKRVSV